MSRLRAAIEPLSLALCALLLSACVGWDGDTAEIAFVGAGGTELRGTLVLPGGIEGPVPAALVLHGAEKATRKRFVYRMQANILLERGIATFMYDKRGAGESGGDHDSATFAELIEDAVAAIAVLRARPEIDPRRVGIMAASESGWLTPEIAERSGGLAFVINKVGPALSWRETVAWEVYNDLRADGASEESAREQAQVRLRLWNYYLAPTPEERSALEAILAGWSGREDSSLPGEIGEPSASDIALLGYDPGPYLERLETPTFYLYGAEDINVPTRECVTRLEELAAAGRPVSHYVFEGEGHELGGVGLWPPGYSFAEGYAKRVGAFALRHAGGPSG